MSAPVTVLPEITFFITRPYELHTTGRIAQNRCEFFAMQLDLKEHDNFLGLNQHYSNIFVPSAFEYGSAPVSCRQFPDFHAAHCLFNLISYGTEADSIAGVQYLTCVLAS